jgi:uncharacterized membrane protein SpoIIM required for sporulation
MEEENKLSPHILNASASLSGFSFIVLTTLRALRLPGTHLDLFAALAVGVFVVSCLSAFLSIRNGRTPKAKTYENIADYSFLVGLFLLFLTAALIELKFL